jgi:tyrosine-protein kinase Etk/Wzc
MSDSLLPQRWTSHVETGPVLGPDSAVADHPVEGDRDTFVKTMLEFVGLLRRHLLLVVLVTAGAVLVAFNQIRRTPHLYQANAVIRIADRARSLSGGLTQAPYSPMMRTTDPLLSQIQILQSQAVATAIADKEGLRLRLMPAGGAVSWIDSVQVAGQGPQDTVKLRFGPSEVSASIQDREARARYGEPLNFGNLRFAVMWRPPMQTAQLKLISLADAAGEVKGNLRGRSRDRTDIIDVAFIATDPIIAQRVVNAAAEVFQNYNLSTAKQEQVRRRRFIEDQLRKAEALLSGAQQAHNGFRSRYKIFSSTEKFRAQQADIAALQLRRQDLDADRQMYQSFLDALQNGRGQSSNERMSALVASPGIASNAVIAQLYGQLVQYQGMRDTLTMGTYSRSPSSSEVKRLDTLITSTQSRIASAVRGQIRYLEERLSIADSLRSRQMGEIATLPGTEAEETRLLSQVQTYERETERLRQELQRAQIDEAAETGQIEIVDRASSPGFPIGAGRRPKMLFALLIGLGLAAVASYVVENYKPVIRRRDELERIISIPSLALVPQIRSLGHTSTRFLPRLQRNNGNGKYVTGPSAELVTATDSRSSGAEAYRTLRTNLLFSAAVRALQRVVVTSPGPEEGKSTTAANLAIAFAQQGHRVLLLDCDLRRSRVHKMFEQALMPGLTNVLVGGLRLDEATRPTRIEGLMILPAGATPPNPAELLGSAQMRALIDAASKEFDVLIMDTPPLLAASDAAILSRMADGALVVVRAGKTERSALQTAVQQLTTVGARILGTVLNDPDAEVPKYARYYGYYYNNYYEYSPSTQA